MKKMVLSIVGLLVSIVFIVTVLGCKEEFGYNNGDGRNAKASDLGGRWLFLNDSVVPSTLDFLTFSSGNMVSTTVKEAENGEVVFYSMGEHVLFTVTFTGLRGIIQIDNGRSIEITFTDANKKFFRIDNTIYQKDWPKLPTHDLLGTWKYTDSSDRDNKITYSITPDFLVYTISFDGRNVNDITEVYYNHEIDFIDHALEYSNSSANFNEPFTWSSTKATFTLKGKEYIKQY